MPLTFIQTGFRPFFLGAAVVGIVAAPIWGVALLGVGTPATPLAPLSWHVHELLFGFVGAVLAGFLLTAAHVWTGRPTASGPGLGVLAGLWVLGRAALFVDLGAPHWLLALPDAGWLVGTAVAIGVPIVRAGSTRNLGFPVILVGMAGAHAVLLLAPELSRWAWTVGLDLVLVALVVVSGRIVPMFTRNAIGDARIGRWIQADRAAVGTIVALVVVDLLEAPGWLGGLVAAAAALSLAVRAIPWRSWTTWRNPLVWVLHVGVGWLIVGLALLAISRLGGAVPTTAATHALTVGAVGTLCLGMMARVSLGHTGRPLIAAPLAVAGFWLVGAAALVRVGAALVGPAPEVLATAAALFGLAFLAYLVGYARILVTPRPDGRPG